MFFLWKKIFGNLDSSNRSSSCPDWKSQLGCGVKKRRVASFSGLALVDPAESISVAELVSLDTHLLSKSSPLFSHQVETMIILLKGIFEFLFFQSFFVGWHFCEEKGIHVFLQVWPYLDWILPVFDFSAGIWKIWSWARSIDRFTLLSFFIYQPVVFLWKRDILKFRRLI